MSHRCVSGSQEIQKQEQHFCQGEQADSQCSKIRCSSSLTSCHLNKEEPNFVIFDPKGMIDLICFFVHSVLLFRPVWKKCSASNFNEGLSSEVENNALVRLFQFVSSTGM